MKRNCNGPIGLFSTQTQARVLCQCEADTTSTRRFGVKKVLGTAKNLAWRKLGPNWEVPYRITSVVGIGTYYLEDLDENIVPCLWNVNNL